MFGSQHDPDRPQGSAVQKLRQAETGVRSGGGNGPPGGQMQGPSGTGGGSGGQTDGGRKSGNNHPPPDRSMVQSKLKVLL